ncbi:hypothetical protein KI688_012128 [Linnemannia hyalina]|uniref:Uncharacterized protein n=1 Tax=Linnemannia hyalina TaxID=64524 RepID=A0A9P8BT74_9FUNG|nr:hypothetical protein KI688_012128 [Linnemannia hyalina]
MATTPTRSRERSLLTLVDTQRHQPDLSRSIDTAQQPISPSSSAKQRKALSRITTSPRTMVMDADSSSGGPSGSRPQRQQQQQQQEEGEEEVTEEGGKDNADETHAPGSPTFAAVETTEEDDEATVTDSPFLVFSPRMINVRRQGGGYKESGLNCTTPTRPRHGEANNWIGDLFSRGRVTRSRRTQDDALVELDHNNNVARREVEDADEDGDEDDDDVGDVSRSGSGFRSPVTPRSQFGRWKFDIMMKQSTMKLPKLSGEDAVTVEEDHGNDDGDEDDREADEDDEGDVSDDTQWPFGKSHIESDPSTPKRRPSKIPGGRFMSPTSPTFRDSGCDDREVVEDDGEGDEEDVAGSDQDDDASKDDSRTLDSLSKSQQEQIAESGDNGIGSSSSSSSSNWSGMLKPHNLNLRHLGGLPSSPSESSSASFHTPPRKRTRKDLDDSYGLRQPPPAPKLISPEQVLQFFPTHSQSPSVLRSLQLRRGASTLDGSFNHSSSDR